MNQLCDYAGASGALMLYLRWGIYTLTSQHLHLEALTALGRVCMRVRHASHRLTGGTGPVVLQLPDVVTKTKLQRVEIPGLR